MEDNQTRNLKTISIIIIIFSILTVFSNGLGSLFFLIMGEQEGINNEVTSDPISFVWSHYLQLCICTVFFGIINIIGAIGLRKLRNWGRVFLIISSLVISVLIIFITIVLINSTIKNNILRPVEIFAIILSMFLFLLPFILLIKYLTKDKIKKGLV